MDKIQMRPYGLICHAMASPYSGVPLAAWRRAHCSPSHLGIWTNHRHHHTHWLHSPLPSQFQPKMFCNAQLNNGLLTILICKLNSSSSLWNLPSGEKRKIARTKMKIRILDRYVLLQKWPLTESRIHKVWNFIY